MTETAQASPTAGSKRDRAAAEFVVFRQTAEAAASTSGSAQRETWERIPGTFKGTQREARRAAKGERGPEGTYVAIPVSSFNPVRLATRTHTEVVETAVELG